LRDFTFCVGAVVKRYLGHVDILRQRKVMELKFGADLNEICVQGQVNTYRLYYVISAVNHSGSDYVI